MTTEEDSKRKALFNELARQTRDNNDQFIAEQNLLAASAKVRFDAFVKAGFTPDQAIQLIK